MVANIVTTNGSPSATVLHVRNKAGSTAPVAVAYVNNGALMVVDGTRILALLAYFS